MPLGCAGERRHEPLCDHRATPRNSGIRSERGTPFGLVLHVGQVESVSSCHHREKPAPPQPGNRAGARIGRLSKTRETPRRSSTKYEVIPRLFQRARPDSLTISSIVPFGLWRTTHQIQGDTIGSPRPTTASASAHLVVRINHIHQQAVGVRGGRRGGPAPSKPRRSRCRAKESLVCDGLHPSRLRQCRVPDAHRPPAGPAFTAWRTAILRPRQLEIGWRRMASSPSFRARLEALRDMSEPP